MSKFFENIISYNLGALGSWFNLSENQSLGGFPIEIETKITKLIAHI